VHRKTHLRFAATLFATALAVLSCTSGESTAPVKTGALPTDSLAHLSITLPLNQMMTSGTTEQLVITAANVKARSCIVSGAAWLGLRPGADSSNTTWSVTPTASGPAVLVTSCTDFRSAAISRSDTLTVFNLPTVTPDMAGTVPVDIADSVDVTYDSTDTHAITVDCRSCAPSGTIRRVGANTIRFIAQQVAIDTIHRAICFTVHGFDARYSQSQCVGVAVMGAQAALFSVPMAIRTAELVPLHTIPVSTYDTTGQSTHPDFMRVNAPWAGGACWMSYTPYANSNGGVENPSLATSPDCEHWTPAAGVKAPLIDQPIDGYNSDPELMYDAAGGCLGVVFRQVNTKNNILITRSCDGKLWTAPRLLFSAPNHSAVSPTVSPDADGTNRVWYVDAGAAGCTSQNNVVKMRIAAPTASLDSLKFGPEVVTDLVQPGYVIWHIKIRYVPEKKMYVAMYVAFPMTTGQGQCTSDDLFLATSADGIHWHSFQAPMLDHLDARFTFVSLYRASFIYNASTDRLRTIVSGLERNSGWGQYGVIHNFSALMTALNSSYTATASQLVAPRSLVRKAIVGPRQVVTEDRP
jgi:hypothetical protein